MAAIDAARVAVKLWPRDLAIVMVAIAGAESGWNPEAGGDTPRRLHELGHYYEASLAEKYNCPPGSPDGPASWGLWQIFMPYHLPKIQALGGPVGDPCETANWLKDPWNNARVADAVLKSQGLGAWTAYRNGTWTRYEYLQTATQVVDQVLAEQKPKPSPWQWLIPLGVAAFGGYLIYVYIAEARGKVA